ncbi:hypothetical protein ACJX0J_024294, partial [Zea mays]
YIELVGFFFVWYEVMVVSLAMVQLDPGHVRNLFIGPILFMWFGDIIMLLIVLISIYDSLFQNPFEMILIITGLNYLYSSTYRPAKGHMHRFTCGSLFVQYQALKTLFDINCYGMIF